MSEPTWKPEKPPEQVRRERATALIDELTQVSLQTTPEQWSVEERAEKLATTRKKTNELLRLLAQHLGDPADVVMRDVGDGWTVRFLQAGSRREDTGPYAETGDLHLLEFGRIDRSGAFTPQEVAILSTMGHSTMFGHELEFNPGARVERIPQIVPDRMLDDAYNADVRSVIEQTDRQGRALVWHDKVALSAANEYREHRMAARMASFFFSEEQPRR